jgi:hypothetical protein
MEFGEFDGTTGHLITDHDLLALSVRRGSLTPYERREIEAHVSHTRVPCRVAMAAGTVASTADCRCSP